MAIEIKELSINVKVNSDSASSHQISEEDGDESAKNERLIEECVQRVLEELSHRKEGR
jgi:hypothetical protein